MAKERTYVDLNSIPKTSKEELETKLFGNLVHKSDELELNRRTDYGTVEQNLKKLIDGSNPTYYKKVLITPQTWMDLFTKEHPTIAIYLSLETYFRTSEDLNLFNDIRRKMNSKLGIPLYGF
ncbi:MAG: hypothetical protein JWM20_115 [Patescibacteria group bacterium]|nr:hypothetical protein [Patescibacteria group bacterium]